MLYKCLMVVVWKGVIGVGVIFFGVSIFSFLCGWFWLFCCSGFSVFGLDIYSFARVGIIVMFLDEKVEGLKG